MSTSRPDPPVIIIDNIDDEAPSAGAVCTQNVIANHISGDINKPIEIRSDDGQITAEAVSTLKLTAAGNASNELPTSPQTVPKPPASEPRATIINLAPPKPQFPNGSPKARRRHSSKEEDLQHLSENDLLLAATLIKDADSGRNFTYKTEPKYVRSYIIYHKWYLRWALYVCILLNLSMALFETPARNGWAVPYWGTMLIELLCIVLFIARVIHCLYFTPKNVFWRDTKNLMVVGIIALTILDMICYIIWVNAAPDKNPVRWSRPLRSLLIINFSDGRQIRRAFRNIRRTVPEIINVLVLFMMSVFLFALLGLKLFGRRKSLVYPDGDPYFKNYMDSVWDLYVLVTTANNPDVMMPAYDESKWFALYFMVYLIICLYVFMSIVLAAIYNNYRNNLKNEIRDAVFGKRRKLRQAFNILKVTRNGEEIITKTVWQTIMPKVVPKMSSNQIDLLMTILDKDSTGTISKRDFLNLTNLLQVPVSEVYDRLTFLEKKIPHIYNSTISNVFKKCVRHKFFRIFFDFMIFLNAWFIGFDVDVADWFFLSIFMFEIMCKMYVFGPKEFFRRLWNIFDFVVIFGAVIATAIESGSGQAGEELSTLDLLLVLRVMRLVKIFVSIKRFRVILMTIMNIGSSMLTYGGVLFVLYYMFAIVGMEIFHGRITYHGYQETTDSDKFCGNPALNNTAFYHNHYCNNNFNDVLRSLVLLFELTVVNQWHVLSSGFVFVTNKAARLYFFAFHMCCVIIVLNIFVAFILEAFILEYSIQTGGKIESEVESKIKELGLGIGQTTKDKDGSGPPPVDKVELVSNEQEVDRTPPVSRAPSEVGDDSDSDTDSIPDLTNERGLRFHLKKKKSKKVEVLLQQMFEGEINPDDEGNEEQYYYRRRALTLDAVT